jgi:magnesium-transporting ATPase (P-type)
MEVPLLWTIEEERRGVDANVSYGQDYDGLSDFEAEQLLKQQPQEEQKSMAFRIAKSVFQVMPMFLLLVAIICFVIEDWITGLVVVSLTVLHVGLTVHEEMQMDASAELLREFLTTVAHVKRQGVGVLVLFVLFCFFIVLLQKRFEKNGEYLRLFCFN